MTILITGGSGLLGSNLCYEFLTKNRKVVTYDVLHRVPKFLRSFENDEKLVFVRGDIEDAWNLLETVKKHNVTEIIHTAALLQDKASIKRPYQFLRTNILGGINVLEIARILKLRRLIIVSSRAAYGSYSPDDGPVREDFPLRPIAFYGASKASLDTIIPLYRTHYKIDTLSIRTTGIFGPGQGEAGMGFVSMTSPIYNILASVLKGEPFTLASGGDYYLESCYVRDLTRGIRLILEAEGVKYPVYNICYGKQFSISELGRMVQELFPESEVNIGPGIPDGAELRAPLDISRAREEFGYAPTPLIESIRDFVKYLKA
jgi:nucleoside-diphosphate-sugar epimerase